MTNVIQLTWEQVFPKNAYLSSVWPYYEYVGGKRSDKQIGWTYSLVNRAGYDKVNVKAVSYTHLSGLLSAAMVNNTIGIIVTCPMAKEIGGKYRIAPKRLASLVDIFACAFLAVMPHDGGMLIVTELAGVSPLSVVTVSYTHLDVYKRRLYTTAEPCAMCAGAIYWAGIGRVVYGMTEKELLAQTGADPQNPTFDLPCREVFARGQKAIEVVGPFPELVEEIAEVHKGYWNN